MDITPTKQLDGQATSSSAAQTISNATTDDSLPRYGQVLHESAGLTAINSGYLSEHSCSEYDHTIRVRDHVSMLMSLLAFVLAADYGHVPSGDEFQLPSAIAEHFLEVGRVLVQQCEIFIFNDLEARKLDVSAITTFCVENITEPARVVGLPVEYVAATITRFTTLVGAQGRVYTGSLEHILATRGPKALASKLWFDRHVLIPRIFMAPPSEKDKLTGALDRAQRRYFEALEGDGLKVWVPVHYPLGWCQLDWKKMVLTKHARGIVHRMSQTTKQLNEARVLSGSPFPAQADFANIWDVDDGGWGAVEAIAAAVNIEKPAEANRRFSLLEKVRRIFRRKLQVSP